MVCGVFNDCEGDAGFTGGCVDFVERTKMEKLYIFEKEGVM